MVMICPYCDMEINEKQMEAEDGCCPECGALITAGNVLSDDEDEYDEYEDEYGEDEDFDFDDDFGDFDDLDPYEDEFGADEDFEPDIKPKKRR